MYAAYTRLPFGEKVSDTPTQLINEKARALSQTVEVVFYLQKYDCLCSSSEVFHNASHPRVRTHGLNQGALFMKKQRMAV